jgi:hypothetical protein
MMRLDYINSPMSGFHSTAAVLLCWRVSAANWSLRILSELDAADRRAKSVAGGLSPSQLNWQPAPGAWSIGQCLEHLRVTNEVMVPLLSASLEGRPRKPVPEIKLGWFTGWFIRNYIAPNPGGARARAPKKIEPASRVEPAALESLLRSTEAARALVKQASSYDVNHIRYRNPFVPLLWFTVGVGLEIIPKHQARHLLQAEAVKQSPGFPNS